MTRMAQATLALGALLLATSGWAQATADDRPVLLIVDSNAAQRVPPAALARALATELCAPVLATPQPIDSRGTLMLSMTADQRLVLEYRDRKGARIERTLAVAEDSAPTTEMLAIVAAHLVRNETDDLLSALASPAVPVAPKPPARKLTATIDLGPEYQWLIDSHFLGGAATVFVGRQYRRWSIGARAHFFGGEQLFGKGDPGNAWSMTALDFSLGAMVERSFGERLRLQAGVGVEVLKLVVHHCYDAGDGCWWLDPHNYGVIALTDVNFGLNLQLGLQIELWRAGRAIVFIGPRIEYTGFFLPSSHYDNNSPQPSRSATAVEAVVGFRL
jgi:hypothetical protein